MVDPGLAQASERLFWIALAVYATAMLAYFAAAAYRGPRAARGGTVLAWSGLLVHAASVITRGFAADRVPWGNMFEYSSMIGLFLVAWYLLFIERRMGLGQLGGFAMAGGVLWLGAARATFAPAGNLVPALDSMWLKIHVLAAIIGSSLFAMSFIFTVLGLVRMRAERRVAPFGGSTVGAAYVGPPPVLDREGPVSDLDEEEPEQDREPRGVGGRLPSAARLDTLAHRTVQFAFPLWTFAVIAGAIWAHEAWGRYWGWDPKETWAFITWVAYAGYLHARATAGWRGTRAAVLNIAAFGVLLFTYFAVNLLISGLHSYAGV